MLRGEANLLSSRQVANELSKETNVERMFAGGTASKMLSPDGGVKYGTKSLGFSGWLNYPIEG